MNTQERRQRLALLWIACLGPLEPSASRTGSAIGFERNEALRGFLRSGANRLLDAPLFNLGLVSDSDLGWCPTAERVADPGQEGDDAPPAVLDGGAVPPSESYDDFSATDWAEVGYDPRYRRIKRLSAQDELRFVALAKVGDRFARQKLVVHYLPLMLAIARHYRHRGLSLSELVNEGTFGFVRAIERFDLARRLRFGTYAKWWMRDAMDQAICQQGRLVRLPSNVLRTLRQHRRREAFEEIEGIVEPADQADVESDTTALLASLSIASNESRVGVDETTPENLVDEKEQNDRLEQALAKLSPRERQVLAGRFGLNDEPPRTLHVLADDLGLSHERVRQIEKTALMKLKTCLALRNDHV